MQRIVVFTGAGISAESGLGTFRDSGGLWEQYKIEDVATPEAFERNPELVLNFYNLRRKQLLDSKPNAAHFALNQLSRKYHLNIITQNIKLNELVGKEFFIGNVKVKAHDLCRPCKHLQDSLKQKNILVIYMYTGCIRIE